MKQFTEKLLHYGVLIVLTIFSVWVMWLMSRRTDGTKQQQGPLVRPVPVANATKAPVAVEPLRAKTCELTATYSGKIAPWETYTIGFEMAGRVEELGKNTQGQTLDDGDRVKAGQVLARLDDRIVRAQRGEAATRVEQAASDLRRAQKTRERHSQAVSESQIQRLVTDLALARAQLEVVTEQFEDATLTSPVDAIISKRMAKAGETVQMGQMAFELVQNEDLLLMLSVPETQIRELEARMSQVQAANRNSGANDPEAATFRAHVELEGRDRFGNPWPPIEGSVYRIAEVADGRTSLFDVEVRLPNQEGILRPGMIATADLVIDRLEGYAVPSVAVIYRQDRARLFTVEREQANLEMLYWSLGKVDIYRARQVNLTNWVDQGPHVIVPADQVQLDQVIVRGQHRLADGQFVRLVPTNATAGTSGATRAGEVTSDQDESANRSSSAQQSDTIVSDGDSPH